MSLRRRSVNLLHQPLSSDTFNVEEALFLPPQHDTAHAIFAPVHYERRYSYPLIVWLHGPGNDERQLMRIMPLVSMQNYVAVAPRGPLVKPREAVGTALQHSGLPAQFPSEVVSREIYDWEPTGPLVAEAEQRIFDSIEVVKQKFHVAAHRVFLAGFDTGGTTAFRVVMNHPERFAGVLSLGGAFPTGDTPLAHLPKARQLPVFLAAGRRSPIYGETEVCADLRLLHSAGLSITLRLYPCGQELSPQMLTDVDRWIIEQITTPSPCVANVH